jgi:hypothetical protein
MVVAGGVPSEVKISIDNVELVLRRNIENQDLFEEDL